MNRRKKRCAMILFHLHFAMIFSCLIGLVVFPINGMAQATKRLSKNKVRATGYIERHAGEFVNWSDQIWEFAEPSLDETRSTKLLVDILTSEGFSIQENVLGMRTVFIATYGVDQPAIGLFGEYDADANASNKTVPRREELVKGGYGHGGHHNLLAIGSLGAALAIKRLIQQGQLRCTVKYFGTTAEGTIGAKAFLAREGYFNELDFSLYWHPAPATWASTRSWDALIDFDIVFSERQVNIIQENKDDSTTLKALEIFVHEMKNIRQRMPDLSRMNYFLHHEGSDLNKTPDTTRLSVRIQCARQEEALSLFHQVHEAVKRTTALSGVRGVVDVHRAMHQFLPNVTAMKVVQKNLESLGPTIYSDDEQGFVKEIQRSLGLPPDGIVDRISPLKDESNRPDLNGYASDIGDASWIAPEVYFVVRTLPAVPMHQWPGTAFSAHSIGHQGMIKASKILAMTIIDYVENKSLQQAIYEDFTRSKKSYTYKSLLTGPVAGDQ